MKYLPHMRRRGKVARNGARLVLVGQKTEIQRLEERREKVAREVDTARAALGEYEMQINELRYQRDRAHEAIQAGDPYAGEEAAHLQAALFDAQANYNQYVAALAQLEQELADIEDALARAEEAEVDTSKPFGGGGGISHAEARDIMIQAFEQVMGRRPSLCERQAAQVVSLAESQYGAGWGAAGAGSNNWGAVQAGVPPCGSNSFLYTDTHPQPDGSSVPYQICFKSYPTPVAGAADVVRIFKRMGIFDALSKNCSIDTLSRRMYEKGYYEGFGATKEDRISNHIDYITRWYNIMTDALNEPKVMLRSGGAKKGGKKGSGAAIAGGLGILALGWMAATGGGRKAA